MTKQRNATHNPTRNATPKLYDRAYFDRWYRDPRRRVISPAPMARRAEWAIATAEYVLGRPLRSVLDVGSGEGHWALPIRRLRPGVRYTGVDPSPYVVRRYGTRRHIVCGTIGALDALPLDGPFDLVLCCAMLNYLEPADVARGLRQLSGQLGGVAHVELFTRGDPVEGDFRGWRWYTRSWAQEAFRRAGLVSIGLHCYAGRERARDLCALERGHQ
jgi:SAM-dependent methyltransferase